MSKPRYVLKIEFKYKFLQYKQYDPITFDVLRVNIEQLANQITVNDLRIFKRISVTVGFLFL